MRHECIYPSFSKIRVWRVVHKIIAEFSKHEECKYDMPLNNGWRLAGIKSKVHLMNVSVEYEFCLYKPGDCAQKSIGFGKLTNKNIRDTIKFISSGKE